jgi:hypothetical protein
LSVCRLVIVGCFPYKLDNYEHGLKHYVFSSRHENKRCAVNELAIHKSYSYRQIKSLDVNMYSFVRLYIVEKLTSEINLRPVNEKSHTPRHIQLPGEIET